MLHRLEFRQRAAELLAGCRMLGAQRQRLVQGRADLDGADQGGLQSQLRHQLLGDRRTLECGDVDGDGVARFTDHVGAGGDRHLVGPDIGDGVPVTAGMHHEHPLRLRCPRHTGRRALLVDHRHGAYGGVGGQTRRPQQPTGQKVVLRQRDSDPVADRGGQQLGGFVPPGPATTGLLGTGEPDQAEIVEPAPQVGVQRHLGRPFRRGVLGEHRIHHVRQGRIDIGHRNPNPRAITPCSTSFVPPRNVKPGR